MQDADRYRLLGDYETPLFEYGQVVFCERFGEVEIVGLTDAKIPWPIGRRPGARPRTIVLLADLVEAVRRESNQAVAHWWGVSTQTVTVWRKVLDVPQATEGTTRLHSEYTKEEPIIAGLKKAQGKVHDPERRRKIADAKRGQPRPPHVLAALRAAHLGRKHSAEELAKRSASHKRRGTIPPKAGRLWTAEEDEAVRTLSTKEAAAKTGRTLEAIRSRRHRLGVPDGRRREQRKDRTKTADE